MEIRLREITWFVRSSAGKTDTAGVLFDGADVLIINGPTGTHLGGHMEKGTAYLEQKLQWLSKEGFVPVDAAVASGSISSEWSPPRIRWRDRALVKCIQQPRRA